MPNMTLAFEPREHCPNSRRAGRIRQSYSDFLGGRAISKGEENMHDFTLAPRELFRSAEPASLVFLLCATLVAYCYICSMSSKNICGWWVSLELANRKGASFAKPN